ncbi:MAG TPA: arginase [Burkholderiales bacterium]|nr:arginase [Burkholderiales bacterium]
MARQIELIGAAWGLGGADPGCAEAPVRLAPMLAQRLAACGVSATIGRMLAPEGRERRRQLAVSRLCGELAGAVADALSRGALPCVLGGDHSCAGGTWTGAVRALQACGRRSLGLVWIDAHMDAHTPRTSPSGRLHGMPVAWLLGQDDDPLYGLATGVLAPQHVCLLGVRSFEPEEKERLERLGVRVLYMTDVERLGLPAALDEALAVATGGTDAYGMSIDLDAITPDEAPAVGTPVASGLRGAELASALACLASRPGTPLAALELVEYSPRLDPDGRSARVAVDLLAAALCGNGGAQQQP